MMDRENLRALGWPEALIDAMENAERALDLGPLIHELGAGTHGFEVTTNTIDVSGTPQVASHGVASYVRW